jgi:hypothetical protein
LAKIHAARLHRKAASEQVCCGCLADLGGSPRNPQFPEPITSKEGRKAGRKRTSSTTNSTSRWDSSRKS